MNSAEFNTFFKQLVLDNKLGLEEAERKEHYKNLLSKNKLIELAARMRDVEEMDDYLEGLGKYLHAELDVIRLQLIPEAMEKEGLNSPVNVDGVGKIVLSGDMYLKVNDKESLYKWLRKMKMGAYIVETVNSSTLKAGLKARIASGKSLPGEAVTITPFKIGRASCRERV